MIIINSATEHLAQGQDNRCGRKREDHGCSADERELEIYLAVNAMMN